MPERRGALPHEVRLIGGQWKRSKLPVVDADGLRPTPDRVRETLFNWLGHDLAGWRCLDAFAGSGALGFEAASRGAASVVLLERDRRVAAALEAVRLRLKAEASVRIEAVDAIAWMARAAPASPWARPCRPTRAACPSMRMAPAWASTTWTLRMLRVPMKEATKRVRGRL